MVTPTVTIGIPTYNGERFIAEAIESVLAQSHADFELIVVDDRSSDATVEIVRSLGDPRIAVYENERRLGIPGNWNRALALARGEYICLFHQDDCMRPENLARKVQLLDADPTIGFVHSGIEILTEPSAPYPAARWIEDSAEDVVIDGPTYLRRLALEGNLICAPTVVARRDHLLRTGGFDVEFGFACDYALWMRLCFDSRIAFLHQPLIKYRWHAENETHRYRFEKGVQEMRRAGLKVVSEYGERLGRGEEASILRAAIEALARTRTWAVELEVSKVWLEEQVRNWQREAEQREGELTELRTWTTQLQTAKAWLEEQATQWQREVERREQTIEELRGWVAQLQSTKAWLEEQVRSRQQEAEQREEIVLEQRRTLESLRNRIALLEQEKARMGLTLGNLEGQAWTRIGRRLHLLSDRREMEANKHE